MDIKTIKLLFYGITVLGFIFLGTGVYVQLGTYKINNTNIIDVPDDLKNKQKDKTQTRSFTIDSRLSDGILIADVAKGDQIEISAKGKIVWKDIPVGNPTKYEEADPNGTSPTAHRNISRESYYSNIGSYLCPEADKGALIGRIGNDKWFPVGDSFKTTIQKTGSFRLAVNDLKPSFGKSNWEDNSGTFNAKVEIKMR